MSKLALMTFTVREEMKKPDQIKKTLEKVASIGVKRIELAYIEWTPKNISLIKRSCEDLGIKVVGSQIKLKLIEKNFDQYVLFHKALKCRTMAVSIIPTKYLLKGEKGYIAYAKRLNKLGERLKAEGISLLHHHHQMEFAKYDNKTGLDILMEQTDPLLVGLEMDTYWTQKGGKNPIDLIHKYHKRIKLIHLRDYQVSLSFLKQDFVESNAWLGQGNMDIGGILDAALMHSIPYLAFEENTKKPFEAVGNSYAYLRRTGYQDLLI